MLDWIVIMQEIKLFRQDFDFRLQGIQREFVHHHKPSDFFLESLKMFHLQHLISQNRSPFTSAYLSINIRV